MKKAAGLLTGILLVPIGLIVFVASLGVAGAILNRSGFGPRGVTIGMSLVLLLFCLVPLVIFARKYARSPEGQSDQLSTLLGRLHIANFGFLIGAMGQHELIKYVLPNIPSLAILCFVLAPWLIVHFITFYKVPPVSQSAFRKCLLFSALWFSILCAGLEVANRLGLIDNAWQMARPVMYIGVVSVVSACVGYVQLRRLEMAFGR